MYQWRTKARLLYKILFIQKFDVFFSFVYLFAIYKHQSVQSLHV